MNTEDGSCQFLCFHILAVRVVMLIIQPRSAVEKNWISFPVGLLSTVQDVLQSHHKVTYLLTKARLPFPPILGVGL